MASRTDDRGRLYLEKALRERYGETFHVVEYRDRIELVPVDDDPLDGLHAAVGDALDGLSVDELRESALEAGRTEALDDVRRD